MPGGWDTGLLPGVTEDAAASTLLLGEQRGLFFLLFCERPLYQLSHSETGDLEGVCLGL